MNCKNVKSLYTAFREKNLNDVTKNEVVKHIKECDSCRKLYESLDRITSFTNKYETLRPESDTMERILKRIGTIPQTKKLLGPRWIIAYATLFVIIAGTSFGIFHRMNVKRQILAKKKQEELYKRKNRYIMDYGQFEKGNVIYSIPGEGNSVKMVEISY
ncbi:MAG: hypothetical protein E3J41_00740 [Candidatus Cloacimonadota bacterium]|nr:MAG: hypothetical protein E3J41_00740 [Candidatus Cloacimonadota bacterium]